jgi:hypothetical protein
MNGWVRVFAEKGAELPDDFHIRLSQAIQEWSGRHKALTIISIVPIMRGGSVVGLHGWYRMQA